MQVPTLQEYTALAKAADHAVGIYVETKHPTWFDSRKLACMAGRTMSELVLDALRSTGYEAPLHSDAWRQQPAFIQSFEVGRASLASLPPWMTAA